MKLIQSSILTSICAIFYGILVHQTANAQNFGINFLGNTPADPVTGTAGVVPLTGWNNIDNTTYASGTIVADDSSTATLTLSGASTGGWRSSGTGDGGNGSLMDGYMDIGNTGAGTAVISGLANGQLYDIYLYTFGDATRPGNNGDLLPNYEVNGTIYYVPTLGVGTSTYDATATTVGGPFSGFVQGTTYNANFNTATANASDFGNYIEIQGVAAVGGELTISGGVDDTSFRSPLNGIEIVAVPEPAAMALTAAGLAILGLICRRKK